jgi:hypothetical protein
MNLRAALARRMLIGAALLVAAAASFAQATRAGR